MAFYFVSTFANAQTPTKQRPYGYRGLKIITSLRLRFPDFQRAQQYFFLRIWSAPATLCQYVILGWFLGRQNTTSPLAIVVTTNVCNICLDLLFVMHYGMNTEGVALASVLAEFTGLVLGIFLITRNLPKCPRSLSWSTLFQYDKIKAMLLINSHLFVRTLCLIFTFSFFTVQGAKFGSATLAANAVLMNFQTFMAYALDGFAHAAEALIGRSLGAKNKALFQQSLKTTGLWSLMVALFFTLTFSLAGKDIINALTHSLSAPDGLIVSRRRREICQSEVRDSARGRLKFYPE
ncbi:MATE family efflux transporter [Bathymodiolus japonicus methanotrophic gill symbiont]|uniref:MATE family efflux transporter n=1 Tax=Bathymodiolus japonicus methanotrophic gill symbiont TaxID=113269 RepID=UPI001C8E1A3A|nr:MATE family efflux transporter [Bathymodiolus japonicus methanotrophic gill symbiont]